MSTITEKTTKQSQHPCGFCSTGHHENCPGGVVNGNLTEVVLCGCPEHEPIRRCIDCGNRGDEVSPTTWTCLDVEACQQKVTKRREETIRKLYGDRPSPEARKAREVKESRTTAPRAPKEGKCLCCGEATKGGLFLPGHDARLLSRLAQEIKNGAPHGKIENELREAGASDALIAKLNKRVQS